MKLFKYLLIMVVAIAVTVSCSKDDDVDNNDYSLVGSWKHTTQDIVNGVVYESSQTIKLNEDLSGEFININNGIILSEGDAPFTWSTDKNKFTYSYPSGEYETLTYSISGNILIITLDGNYDVAYTRL